jgi:NADH dehydrogenase
MLATIGRAAGVAHIGRFQFSGLFAWLLWLFVHIYFLIGFRNRLLVLIEWSWAYFTHDRGARLITGQFPEPAASERSMTVPMKEGGDGS